MKKTFILLTSIMLLSGCAETVVLLGPASSIIGGGNVVQSSLSSAANYGIKKTTGKSTMQHALAFAEEQNPNKNKDHCISFIKRTESEACYIAKKQISSVKKSATKKIKNVITPSKNKAVNKIRVEQELPLQAEAKQLMVKRTTNLISPSKSKKEKIIRVKKEPQLKSVEAMLINTAMSKKQISHLSVSIKKKYKVSDLSR